MQKAEELWTCNTFKHQAEQLKQKKRTQGMAGPNGRKQGTEVTTKLDNWLKKWVPSALCQQFVLVVMVSRCRGYVPDKLWAFQHRLNIVLTQQLFIVCLNIVHDPVWSLAIIRWMFPAEDHAWTVLIVSNRSGEHDKRFRVSNGLWSPLGYVETRYLHAGRVADHSGEAVWCFLC